MMSEMNSKEDKRKVARTQGRFTDMSEGASKSDSKSHNKKNDDQNKRIVRKSDQHESEYTKPPRSGDVPPHQNRRQDENAGHTRYDDVPPRQNRRQDEYAGHSRYDNIPPRYRRLKERSNVAPDENPIRRVKFEEDSGDYKFKHLEPSSQTKEISSSGMHSLSTTKNGESRVYYNPNFIAAAEGYTLFHVLRQNIKWHDKNIVIRGEEYPQPRLVAWFGPLPYTYSGVTFEAKELPDTIMAIKKKVEEEMRQHGMNAELNSVLANLYRSGKDSVAWHCDDEELMSICPTIASVSLGEVRRFEMRPKPLEPNAKHLAELVVNLKHGSLIVMDGAMQLDWQHRVPKEYHDKGERINLTFRTVYKVERISQPISFSEMPNNMVDSTPRKPFEYSEENFPSLSSSALNSEQSQRKTTKVPLVSMTESSFDALKHEPESWDTDEPESWDTESNICTNSSVEPTKIPAVCPGGEYSSVASGVLSEELNHEMNGTLSPWDSKNSEMDCEQALIHNSNGITARTDKSSSNWNDHRNSIAPLRNEPQYQSEQESTSFEMQTNECVSGEQDFLGTESNSFDRAMVEGMKNEVHGDSIGNTVFQEKSGASRNVDDISVSACAPSTSNFSEMHGDSTSIKNIDELTDLEFCELHFKSFETVCTRTVENLNLNFYRERDARELENLLAIADYAEELPREVILLLHDRIEEVHSLVSKRLNWEARLNRDGSFRGPNRSRQFRRGYGGYGRGRRGNYY